MAQKKLTAPVTTNELSVMDSVPTLILSNKREITPAVWTMIKEISQVVFRGYGFTRPDDAAAVMLKGYEVGFGIAASIEFIQSIAGKPPTVSPKGAMALLHNSPVIQGIEITRLTEKGAFIGYECKMTRSNGFSHTSRFTLEDAIKAGLMKADSGWMKYPENMCQWRAIGFAADVVAPDITAGMTTLMKMPEAYGVTITANGDVIDAKATNITATTPLQDLLAQYSPAVILEANGGAIPQTDEEIAAVREKLERSAE